MLHISINLHIIPIQLRLNYHSPAKYRLETQQNCNFITLYFTILYNKHFILYFSKQTLTFTIVLVCVINVRVFSRIVFCFSFDNVEQQLFCNNVPCFNVSMFAFINVLFSLKYLMHFLFFKIKTTNKHTILYFVLYRGKFVYFKNI